MPFLHQPPAGRAGVISGSLFRLGLGLGLGLLPAALYIAAQTSAYTPALGGLPALASATGHTSVATPVPT